MRYIFFTLLLANVGYFVYASYGSMRDEPDVRVTTTVPRYPASVETIYLLNENDGAREEQLSIAVNDPVRSDQADAGDCLALGPFSNLFDGQAVVERLESLDISAELRAVDQSTGENDYRVMIPPMPSLQDAFRKLRELKSRDVDSYVITQGKDALGISLGVFSTLEAAQAARQQRSREGYEADIVEIQRLAREFWIFPGSSRNLELAPSVRESLTAEHPGLVQRLMPCPAPSA